MRNYQEYLISRKSPWIRNALSKGVLIESVSRVLGHTNIVTTQKYCKITTEKIDKDLTMFGDRLNQSFHEVSIEMYGKNDSKR